MTELSDLLPAFDPMVRALGLTLLHALWQCAVIGGLAWLALHALRNATARARYAVACAALASCVIWPAVRLAHALAAPLSPPATVTVSTVGRDIAHAPASNGMLPIGPLHIDGALPWIVALWTIGAALMLLRLGVGLRWVARLQRSACEAADPAWQARLDRLAQRFDLSGIRLAVIDNHSGSPIAGPLVAGVWRPMVLVPAALLARMPVEMLEALLAHELAHIRRHDYLANMLQRIAEALLFYHPVVWWLSGRIRLEREFVADDLAAAVTREPRRLALALAALDRFSPPVPSLAQAAHGGHLMSRIQSLLRPQPRASAGVVLLPIAGIALACLGVVAYAQSAQTRAPAAVVPKITVGTLTASGAAATTRSSAARDTTETYALVDGDSDQLSISGSSDETDAIRAAKTRIDGDFLWLRRGGKAYVMRDPATLDRVRTAWSTQTRYAREMEALSAQMQTRSEQMQALGQRVEASAMASHETPGMRKAIDALEAMAKRQGALAEQQAALATTMAANSDDEKAMAEAERKIEALDAQMETLGAQMEVLQSAVESESEKMAAELAPVAALESEMEAASAPMEALGAQMEALGREQEREMTRIDRDIRGLIDEAVANGLASPIADTE